ncbi:MAG: AtpZ/AtpI family protein [Rhodothermia bacterium]|nr:AtpZ/AtpI family protein [Rhodothermia bacterium]
MTEGNGRADWRRSLGEAGPLLGLGMQMALTMALFAGGGFWLDSKFNTLPWITLAGAVTGVAILAFYLYRLIRELDEKNRRSKDGR